MPEAGTRVQVARVSREIRRNRMIRCTGTLKKRARARAYIFRLGSVSSIFGVFNKNNSEQVGDVFECICVFLHRILCATC